MSEQELTPEIASRLYGPQPVPEPEPSELESKAEPSEADREHDAARAHNEFHAALFRQGDAAKREADERFLRAMHPPTKEGDE